MAALTRRWSGVRVPQRPPTRAVGLAPGTTAASSNQDVVTVTNQAGVVRIGTSIPGQPLLGASIDTNTSTVCVGFSYQIPTCATAGGIAVGAAASVASPVWVDAAASDGSIGAGVQLGTGGIAAVRYSTTTGQLCAGIGMQRPVCPPPAGTIS